jgi:hypothetical protein
MEEEVVGLDESGIKETIVYLRQAGLCIGLLT